jgi:chemotaxis protein methyltransferase CheR
MKRHFDYWNALTESTGYDFSGYASEPVNRRLEPFISDESIGSSDEIRSRMLAENATERNFSPTPGMFHDPGFYASLRRNVLPHLAGFSEIKIWIAGCSTGEDVYSLAILLDESGLLNRCTIHSTDISTINLTSAERGIFPLHRMKEGGARYFQSGGIKNLSNHYTGYYDHVIFRDELRRRMIFSYHDLLSDPPFGRFHLVLCRNVMIFFENGHHDSLIRKIRKSLSCQGFLGLGKCESLREKKEGNFIIIDAEQGLFRKDL